MQLASKETSDCIMGVTAAGVSLCKMLQLTKCEARNDVHDHVHDVHMVSVPRLSHQHSCFLT